MHCCCTERWSRWARKRLTEGKKLLKNPNDQARKRVRGVRAKEEEKKLVKWHVRHT
jgi:hypothetical protein